MGVLTVYEIEFLQRLIEEYQDTTDDLSQREWANAQAISDKLEGLLDD